MRRAAPRALAILAIPILFSNPCRAQATVMGDWQGTLAADDTRLRLVLHIAQRGDALEATIDSPDQGTVGAPTVTVMFEDGTLTIATGRIGSEFVGTLSRDGQTISGSWKQRGAEVPLVLTRKATAPASRQVAANR